MKQDSQSFFDARTLIAIAVMGLTFVGWQTYLQKKYPNAYKKSDATVQTVAPKADEKSAVVAPVTATPTNIVDGTKATTPESRSVTVPTEETLEHYQSVTMEFDISSRGMGLKNYKVLQFKDRKGGVVEIGQNTSGMTPLETRLLGRNEPLSFKIEKVNENLFVGRASLGDLRITKTMEIVPEKYLLRFKISAVGQNPKFVGLTTVLVEQLDSPKKGNLLLPQLEHQEFYFEMADTHQRTAFKKDDHDDKVSKVKLASIGSQYFTQALIDKSDIMPEAKARLSHSDDVADILVDYPVLTPGQEFKLDYEAFVGPKSYNLLRSIDPQLSSVVDFGFFNFIARHIFDLLQWFYSLVGNWGVAIICLTLVVRAVVLPFNIYSYKSMKQMQAIQPQIKALKERYKDDQQKGNAEVMRIMRENKVNPLGGCLPVLLQFPIFFALYQMLGHTVELYQAPFALWIHDLSLKDPYYILPVLMGVTMFIQQKTTPNATMDPSQAKIMMMMPLIFTFFMISLPSGLALYMLVGAVFSVAQQTYFMKKTKTPSLGAT